MCIEFYNCNTLDFVAHVPPSEIKSCPIRETFVSKLPGCFKPDCKLQEYIGGKVQN